jgi:predicted DNA-binding transcriptional regulator AlpA
LADFDDDDLLTKKQLARALNTSERTIERWMQLKQSPPFIRLPTGGLRWRWGSVRRWLADREREGE